MKKTTKGRFYFKKTINGNLLGEFSNNGLLENITESADLIENTNKSDFEGLYHSTWFEDVACSAKLKIEKTGGVYSLIWFEGGNFEGQGMLCENSLLIGNYWSI